MEERFLRVDRTARYHVLGEVAAARNIWIVVHGYGQLARYFLTAFEDLAEERLIVAPEGLSRFYTDDAHQRVGATWMTREDRLHEIDDHVAYLDALVASVGQVAPGLPVNGLGFSQGVATVTRWALRGRTRLHQLVLWGGQLPPELDTAALTNALSTTRIDLVHGEQDKLVPERVFRDAEERLRSAALTLRTHTFPGGHALDPVILSRCMKDGN